MPPLLSRQVSNWLTGDRLGMICSFFCAIHCGLTPILLVLLPSLSSLRFLADPLFHQIAAVVCCWFVVQAILPVYRRNRFHWVPSLAWTGVFILFLAAFVLPDRCCNPFQSPTVAKAPSSTVENSVQESSKKQDPLKLVGYGMGSKEKFVESESSEPASATVVVRGAEFRGAEYCDPSSTWGQTLLTGNQLQRLAGESAAAQVLRLQPFLTPLAGCFLMLAHFLNLRQRGAVKEKSCSGGCNGHCHPSA